MLRKTGLWRDARVCAFLEEGREPLVGQKLLPFFSFGVLNSFVV